MTAGSIEGAGTYELGSKALTVGSNNLSTEVSGTIVDGGVGGTGGSLIKVGTGTLTLIRRQYLYRRHDNLGRHTATGRRRCERLDPG